MVKSHVNSLNYFFKNYFKKTNFPLKILYGLTVLSTSILLILVMVHGSLIIQKHTLLEAKKKKISSLSTALHRPPPADYRRYMQLWLFHKIAKRIELVSEEQDENTKNLIFRVKGFRNVDNINDLPFGAISFNGNYLTWTISAISLSTRTPGVYEQLDSAIHLKIQYIFSMQDEVRAMINNKQIRCKSGKAGEFLPLPEEVQICEHAFLCKASSNALMVRCETTEGEYYCVMECDQEVTVNFLKNR